MSESTGQSPSDLSPEGSELVRSRCVVSKVPSHVGDPISALLKAYGLSERVRY